jgi:hypothetical protein
VGDLLEALEQVGAHSGEDVYWAFRALTVSARDQVPAFDKVFVELFSERAGPILASTTAARPREWAISLPDGADGQGDGEEEVESFVGASAAERLAHKDFSELTDEEQAEVRGLIARMIWQPANTVSRRRHPVRVGDRPDMRRTLRRAVGLEGDMMAIASTERRIRRRPLVFIADISGSMERYSEMLLYFAHAARGRLGRLEAFVFSTRLTRITRELARREPSAAIDAVSHTVHDWSGGTQIGASLRTFNIEWSRRVTRGGPIVLIVSDGWDRGEPELLSQEMARLARAVHRVVWLNPLAGRMGYSPETRGMRAALPFVDDFLAAGNLVDLASLVRMLESVPVRARR